MNGGTCSNHAKGYECTCRLGYRGDTCHGIKIYRILTTKPSTVLYCPLSSLSTQFYLTLSFPSLPSVAISTLSQPTPGMPCSTLSYSPVLFYSTLYPIALFFTLFHLILVYPPLYCRTLPYFTQLYSSLLLSTPHYTILLCYVLLCSTFHTFFLYLSTLLWATALHSNLL